MPNLGGAAHTYTRSCTPSAPRSSVCVCACVGSSTSRDVANSLQSLHDARSPRPFMWRSTHTRTHVHVLLWYMHVLLWRGTHTHIHARLHAHAAMHKRRCNTQMVPNPDVEGRRQILESYFANVPKADDVQLLVRVMQLCSTINCSRSTATATLVHTRCTHPHARHGHVPTLF